MSEIGDDIKPKQVEHDHAKDDAPPSLIHSIMDDRVKEAAKPTEKTEAAKPHDLVASISDTVHHDADWLAENLSPSQIAAGLEKSLQSAAAKIAMLTAGGVELPLMGPSFLAGLVAGQDSAAQVTNFMKTVRNYIEK